MQSAQRGWPHQSGWGNLNKLFLWVRSSQRGGTRGFGRARLHYCALLSFLLHSEKTAMHPHGCSAAVQWPIKLSSCFLLQIILLIVLGRCYHINDSEDTTMEFKGNGRTNDGCPTQILPVWRLHLVATQTGVAVIAQTKGSTEHFCFISSFWDQPRRDRSSPQKQAFTRPRMITSALSMWVCYIYGLHVEKNHQFSFTRAKLSDI